MPSLKKIIQQFNKKMIALQVVQLDECMSKMVVDIKEWAPECDVVDMAPLLRKEQMMKIALQHQARFGHLTNNAGGANSGNGGTSGQDDEEDFETKKRKMEEEIREQFMKGTNDGMQRQMNQRFVDREVMRRMQEGI